MIGQMANAIALIGFNDLGRSVTPTFLFRNRFHLQLSPHCPKMNKKSMWEAKKISRFLSTGHRIFDEDVISIRDFNTVITQKGSPNSKLYSCGDSERNRFSENYHSFPNMIGAKLSDQRNSSNAGRFKSTNQRLASRGYLASARENRGKPSADW